MHHVLLLVTPDPAAARMLRGLVESMGDVAWEVASIDEARVALAQKGCCGVILDAAIDEEPGPRDRAHRTLSALAELRAKDARRNAAGSFVLPILLIAPEDESLDDSDARYAAGASAVVRKPLAARRELLARKIEAILGRAGREDHAACAVNAVNVPGRGVHLALTGARTRGRTGFRMNAKPGDVQNGHFVVLLRLALAHGRRRGGWSSRAQLGITRNPEIPSRLRAALRAFVSPGYEPLEADWSGSFRPEMTVEVDLDALEEHSLPVVRKIVKEERELRAKARKRAG